MTHIKKPKNCRPTTKKNQCYRIWNELNKGSAKKQKKIMKHQ